MCPKLPRSACNYSGSYGPFGEKLAAATCGDVATAGVDVADAMGVLAVLGAGMVAAVLALVALAG